MLKFFLALALVTFTVANFDFASAQAQAQVVRSLRMKSYLVTPKTSAQIDEIKHVLRVASANYYVHNGLLQPNIRSEILVPGASDMYFRSAMQRAGVQVRVLYDKVKVKKYGMPNERPRGRFGINDDSHPTNDTGINYEIKGLPSQKLVDVEEGYSDDNTKVIIFHNHDGRNQRWALKSAPGFVQTYRNWFNYVSMETGKCLTAGVDMKFSEDITPVVDYQCQSPYNDSQMWAIEYDTHKKSTDPNDPTYFKIIGNQGKCLTANPNGQERAQLYLSTCMNTDDQFFNFINPDAQDEWA